MAVDMEERLNQVEDIHAKEFARGIYILALQSFPYTKEFFQTVKAECIDGCVEEVACLYNALLLRYPEEFLLGYLMAQVTDSSLESYEVWTGLKNFLMFLQSSDRGGLFYKHYSDLFDQENPSGGNDFSSEEDEIDEEVAEEENS